MISVKTKGNFNNTEKFLKKMKEPFYYSILNEYGRRGVEALREATPKDTGKTAESWHYEVLTNGKRIKLRWYNDNMAEAGMPIAVLIQYGHVTKNGGYVEGRDYINPALRPIFDSIASLLWREVTNA